ncbi:Inner membrane protein translocase component YidC, long form [Rhodovulum sp. PH10]|uniref:membrane protein insertase YidC n=1 Tax=Rhodovulum sp. PH10 TaxID=1187851 RepID=UPI00027C1EFB|nr:membrane protein insertase YidC [Rhodovulum sp. PH10]EJW09703.1 Inner membrane protein translocase component YidC, long form [Rhodovulum sp. PH10]
MNEQKNVILAIALSAVVLIVWQFFFGMPQLEKQRQIAQQQQQQQQAQPVQPGAGGTAQPSTGTPTPGAGTSAPPVPGQTEPSQARSREAVIAAGPRVPVETPNIHGSIALTGARIDDVALVRFRETVDPKSPAIVLLSPSGTPQPFYAEFGWVGAAGQAVKLPGADTVWRQEGSGALTPSHPVTLVWDNGEGLQFRRTITVDDKFLFTVKDDVTNSGGAPVTLYPYALISRHGTPHTLGYYILHEGLVGVLGDQGLQELTYKTMDEKKAVSFKVTNAWLGITDKYWAATLLPDPSASLQAKFSAGTIGTTKTYQTDYLLDPQTIQPGGTVSASGRLFAGAKEVSTVDGYDKALQLNRFELLIDWGWFYFITKPMFWVIDFLFQWTHNFGIAILLVTVLIKGVFFPLANKSYASMAKMKSFQPQMQQIKERFPDDKVKQQQELMDLYKREKINPIAGCWPVLIQIPVFFSLYKVLFITIEMRHAPFFGWIHDLSAPDPTTVFNLFGLLPFDPMMVPMIGSFLHLGAWPLIMGVTMWVQMQLNPTPPDPTQKMIFTWMPVLFTFMLANFPAGLVIYWTWNNLLSVIQQAVIMRKNGAKIELFDNIKGLIPKRKTQE